MALSNLGDKLGELDRPGEASRAASEATRILAPFFHRLPQAHTSLMSAASLDNERLAEAAAE